MADRPTVRVSELDDDEWFAFHGVFGQGEKSDDLNPEHARTWRALAAGMSVGNRFNASDHVRGGSGV